MIESIARSLLPPFITNLARRIKRFIRKAEPPEWELLPDGWSTVTSRTNGWSDESILEAQLARWPQFLRHIEGSGPLGVAFEHPDVPADNHSAHNTTMIYAYVLGLASHNKDRIALLDWGGGIGHYYALSKALFPSLTIDYHVYDMPQLCEGGRRLLPEVRFHDDEACLEQHYDLVMASGSLQFSRDWQRVLSGLASASRGYVYITRLPCVERAPSFVVVQRALRYGYRSEFVGFVLNKGELLEFAASIGLSLIREFRLQEAPFIHGAPEQSESRGFLFRVVPAN